MSYYIASLPTYINLYGVMAAGTLSSFYLVLVDGGLSRGIQQALALSRQTLSNKAGYPLDVS